MCILQRDPKDKNWQIEQMNSLFRGCWFCVALLGGVQQLVGLEEETPWARRAWTLQEALVPPVTRFVFRWTKGAVHHVIDTFENIIELEPGHSAMLELAALLGKVIKKKVDYFLEKDQQEKLTDVVRIIEPDEAQALKCAMYNDAWGVRSGGVQPRRGVCDLAVWDFVRRCSREMDMVFSIMGLFGVTLDTSQFSKKDRKKATIALAQKIMENGGKADWLGLAFGLGPAKFMSTMQRFQR